MRSRRMRERRLSGEFVKFTTKEFKKAGEKVLSIILLDDLDKFAYEDNQHRNAEGHVAVQSCIDDLAQQGTEVLCSQRPMMSAAYPIRSGVQEGLAARWR